MLLASCASVLLTLGLIASDYKEKKKQERQEAELKEQRSKYQTIRILLTGGPYISAYQDAEGRVRESTAFITLSRGSQRRCSLCQRRQPSLEAPGSLLIYPNSSPGKSSSSRSI